MPHSKEAEAPAAQRRGGGGAGAVVILSTATVFAAAQWNRGPTLTLSGTTLYLSGKATGLGNAQSVDFVVSGTALVNARCYTRKGNTPQAANKQDQNEVLSEFSVPVQNGQTTLDNVFVATLTSTLKCPGGQTVVIESVDFSDLQIDAAGYPSLTFSF